MPDFTPSVYFFSYLGTGSTFITEKINRTEQFVGYSDELDKIGKNIGNIYANTPNNQILYIENIGITDRHSIIAKTLFYWSTLHDFSIKLLAKYVDL